MTTNEHKPLEGLADYLRTMACNKEYSDSRRASLRVWADEVEAASLPCTRSHPHENMSAECERLTAIARENNEVASLPQGDVEGLSAVYDEFGIGALAREPHILLENVRNVHRRERCLSAIEREFFTIETPPDPDEGDEEPGEECLLNWGADPAEYVEQFRDALASRLAAPPSIPEDSRQSVPPEAWCSAERDAAAARIWAERQGLRIGMYLADGSASALHRGEWSLGYLAGLERAHGLVISGSSRFACYDEQWGYAAPQPQPAGVPQAGAHQDLADTIAAMLAAVGYTEEYARQWPKEKASVTFKRWFDEQIAAARGVAVAGANHAAFKAWADREGRDTACNYDTERSRWVFFSPMTADLWKCWQASSPVAPAAQLAPRMPSDERLHQLATNRCIAQQWPLHGREWVFNEEGLRNFADAVVSDTFPAAPSPEGEKK
jgi:hypothetical protein